MDADAAEWSTASIGAALRVAELALSSMPEAAAAAAHAACEHRMAADAMAADEAADSRSALRAEAEVTAVGGAVAESDDSRVAAVVDETESRVRDVAFEARMLLVLRSALRCLFVSLGR